MLFLHSKIKHFIFRCNIGFYGYPDCIPCDCDFYGTEDNICTVGGGNCPCKPNFDGQKCDMCLLGFYNFPECVGKWYDYSDFLIYNKVFQNPDFCMKS